MQLQDLVDASQLGVRPLYLPDDALLRDVTWAFTTDLPDPSRYLTPGQLVLTGLVWRQSASDSEGFVAAVAKSGATALVVGEGFLGHVPADVVDACAEHNLPLFAVPSHVSFASITAFISNTLAQNRLQRLAARLARQRQMLLDAYRGQLLDTLIDRTATELGRPIWVISAGGRHVVDSLRPLEGVDLDVITAAALKAPQPPVTVVDSRGQHLSTFVVSALGEHRVTAWFLVVGGDWTQWDSALLDSVHELAGLAGLYRLQQSRQVDSESGDRLIELICMDDEQPETSGYLRQAGIGPDDEALVIAACFTGMPGLQDLASSLLADAIAQVARPIVGRDGTETVLAIVPAAGPTPWPPIADALRRATKGLSEVLSVGLSHPARPDQLGGALRAARSALLLDKPHTSPGDEWLRIVDSGQIGSAIHLLAAVPDQLRRAYVEQVLGQLIDHDARTHSELVTTLRAFLDCGGSWVRTAELTHLHLNSVRYRISRIEAMTGRDLASTADRADFHLALNLG